MTLTSDVEALRPGEPPANGRFGAYGGRFVPETLMPALLRLESALPGLLSDPVFTSDLAREHRDFIGRPTPLTLCPALSREWGAEVWLKREDLCHTGAHKINNAVGQVLVARHLGMERIVAETGAGQHGVATAAAAARFGMPCRVYMGEVDIDRQRPNVERMRLLGAEVVAVDKGDKTLRAAISEAIRDWVTDPDRVFYVLGSVVGPHPYPWMVREFQTIIGREALAQLTSAVGAPPDVVVACVGGGSNAIGIFHPFLEIEGVDLLGVEAGGNGSAHSATLSSGRPGVLHGAFSPLLQDPDGQLIETHSIAPGLDYPGVGPEHAQLRDSGRAKYVEASDEEALDSLRECANLEGIIPALESAHALAGARRWAAANPGSRILIGLSGRGDKDLDLIRERTP
jgi:tryptophan synthase beta chain